MTDRPYVLSELRVFNFLSYINSALFHNATIPPEYLLDDISKGTEVYRVFKVRNNTNHFLRSPNNVEKIEIMNGYKWSSEMPYIDRKKE